jgi:hypothetical protein
MVSFATRRVGLSMHRLVGSPSWGRRKWRGASASLTAGCSVHEVLRKSSEIATGRVANPEVYALPADLEASMDALLASDERDVVVETLFRELESMSEEDLSALRSPPGPDVSRPPLRSLASCVLKEGPGWILNKQRRSPCRYSY